MPFPILTMQLDILCVFISRCSDVTIWNARLCIVALQLVYGAVAMAVYLWHHHWPHSRGADSGYGILSSYVMLIFCCPLLVAVLRTSSPQRRRAIAIRLIIPLLAFALLSLSTVLSLYIPPDAAYLVVFVSSLAPLVEMFWRVMRHRWGYEDIGRLGSMPTFL